MISLSRDVKAALRDRQRGFLLNPYRFGAASDPYFANVSLLCHFDGANGSTTFTDSGPAGRTITRFGDTQISTAQYVFGGASVLFDGTGDYLTTPNASAFAFGSGAYTVEFRVRFTALAAGLQCVLRYANGTIGTDTDLAFGFNYLGSASGKLRAFHTVGSTYTLLDTTTTIVVDTWYAFALVREAGGTTRLFLDGVQEASASGAGAINDGGSMALHIGRWTAGDPRALNGYVDELRITKGVARYTANYALATAAFPNS